jgi:hypothetical protein
MKSLHTKNPKFWYTFEGLGMKNVGHLEYFTPRYILWEFGAFSGRLEYQFVQFLNAKNLATLLTTEV